MQKQIVKLPRATLDIYKYTEDGITYYEFDATNSQPPEPMINTIVCLGMINKENEKVVGTFFHEPTPLYDRISNDFNYEATELKSGDFRIVFTKK
jgi:hypothetical protein